MLFRHLSDVICEAHVLSITCVACRGKAQEFGNFLTVGEVFDRTFLEHIAEVLPENSVLFLVFGQLTEHSEYTLGERTLEFLRHRAFLQQFTGNVKRQIVGVNQTADETQVVGQELFCLVHNENALHKELQSVDLVASVKIPRCASRYIEQGRVFEFAFNSIVSPGKGIFKVVAQMLIKLLVLFFGHFTGINGPKRLGVVDLHPIPGTRGFIFAFLGFFVLFFPQHHRHGDVIGILGDGRAHRPGFQEIFTIGLEVQRNACAACFARDRFARICTFARTFPTYGLVGSGFGRTRLNRHLVGHDKGGVEADAELTDQLAVLSLIARKVA